MSGIVGIYYLDRQPVEHEHLARMVDVLAHRGPDGADIWCNEAIGLGHRMLWTTPESLLEKLPLVKGNLAITADARIDNREELIPTLQLDGYPIEKISDSEIILAAYEKWGEHCPKRLLGDFAFAIWDGINRSLFCARDRFGVKPFYYYQTAKILVFASEIKALHCLPCVPNRLNEARIVDYLEASFDNAVVTFFEDIFRLPPAHTMTVNHSGIKKQSYYSLDPTYELRLASDAEYAEAFREIFIEAVSCRLRSTFTVGSTLSGGLDSSAISCVARDLLQQANKPALPTFSLIFDNVPKSDERAFQNAVIARGGIEPHQIHGDRISPLTDIDRMLWHQDEPFYCPNLFLNWGVYDAARQQGVRVMLEGFDGDTAVSHGLGYLDELAHARHWIALAREARGFARNFDRSAWQVFWKYVRKHNISPLVDRIGLLRRLRQAKQQWYRYGSDAHAISENPIVNSEFIKRIRWENRQQNPQTDLPIQPWTERSQHYQLFTRGQLPFVQEVLDRTAAAFSLEVRYPFSDCRLVEFCLSLPPEQKMYRGWTRMILRRGMEGILPKEIQWRGNKANLGHNFEYVLRTLDCETIRALLDKNCSQLIPYLNLSSLTQTYQSWMNESKSQGGESTTIWNATTLCLWLQQANLG